MPTKHLMRVRKKLQNGDAAAVVRVRKWALFGLYLFLGAMLVAFGLMIAGIGVPAWGWGRV